MDQNTRLWGPSCIPFFLLYDSPPSFCHLWLKTESVRAFLDQQSKISRRLATTCRNCIKRWNCKIQRGLVKFPKKMLTSIVSVSECFRTYITVKHFWDWKSWPMLRIIYQFRPFIHVWLILSNSTPVTDFYTTWYIPVFPILIHFTHFVHHTLCIWLEMEFTSDIFLKTLVYTY